VAWRTGIENTLNFFSTKVEPKTSKLNNHIEKFLHGFKINLMLKKWLELNLRLA
jgi:hypothetical protein